MSESGAGLDESARSDPLRGAADAFLNFVGECTLLLGDAIRRLLQPPFEWRETLNQMAFIGVNSVPIVVMTGFFSGAVLALYLARFLGDFGGTSFVGATVALTIAREVGPVITGIMVAARGGSAMAAQIGTMAVTEQIDALRMLSVHPTRFLVLPRILAGILMLPVLVLISMWSGILGGYLVAQTEGISSATFLSSMTRYVRLWDFQSGMIKTPFFGLIVAVVACQQGLRTKDGAVGVGRATTNSVVISMVLIYTANFLLARLLY